MTPAVQRELFQAALSFIGKQELTNAVVEIEFRGKEIESRQYSMPSE